MMLVTWLPKVTIALYGGLVSELPTEEPPPASARSLHFLPTPLPRYLEISSAQDPTSLAKSLCTEAVGNVTILHLLRLMFLLKPADADWDIPNYPAKYADIGSIPDLDPMEPHDLIHPKQRWLEQAMEELRFPIHDEETQENIRMLAEPLAIALETPVGMLVAADSSVPDQFTEYHQTRLAHSRHCQFEPTPAGRCSDCPGRSSALAPSPTHPNN